jgi:hypothetical protein
MDGGLVDGRTNGCTHVDALMVTELTVSGLGEEVMGGVALLPGKVR